MERERYQATSVYSAKFQSGGSRKARSKPSSEKSKNVLSYSPSTTNDESSLATLFKQNRILRKELDKVTSKLQEVTSQLAHEKSKHKLQGI